MMTITALRKAVDSYDVSRRKQTEELLGHAAVAMVFAGNTLDLNLCFIQRSINESDPWSGQMAFPGGRFIPQDRSLQHAVVRETSEEVGLNLQGYQYLGVLPEKPIVTRGCLTGGTVTPFVYYWGVETPGFIIDPVEVAVAKWISFCELRDSTNRIITDTLKSGSAVKQPAVRVDGSIIWGMTYRMVFELFDRIEKCINTTTIIQDT